MKATILLTTAIFLLSAPAPDSKTLSEASEGLLAPQHESGLMASDEAEAESVKTEKKAKPSSKPKKESTER